MVTVTLLALVAPISEAECVRRFDRALLAADGAALRTVMHPKIVRNSPASGDQLTTFLKTIFWPSLANSMARTRAGTPIPIRSKANVLHFEFQDAAGWNTVLRNAGDPSPVFRPVITRTSEGYRVVTDYVVLTFFAADTRANSPRRNRYEEMQDSQRFVEDWAPRLDRLGIKGGSDGWQNPFRPWRVVIASSRKEVERMRPRP